MMRESWGKVGGPGSIFLFHLFYRKKVTVQNPLRICEGIEQIRKKSSGYYEQQGGCYGYF